MERSTKDIIEGNRTLLIKNIVPCDDFYQILSEQNVFSEHALKEIKVI